MLRVDLLVLLCKEDLGNCSSMRSLIEDLPDQLGSKQIPGNCYQVFVLSRTQLEREVAQRERGTVTFYECVSTDKL